MNHNTPSLPQPVLRSSSTLIRRVSLHPRTIRDVPNLNLEHVEQYLTTPPLALDITKIDFLWFDALVEPGQVLQGLTQPSLRHATIAELYSYSDQLSILATSYKILAIGADIPTPSGNAYAVLHWTFNEFNISLLSTSGLLVSDRSIFLCIHK